MESNLRIYGHSLHPELNRVGTQVSERLQACRSAAPFVRTSNLHRGKDMQELPSWMIQSLPKICASANTPRSVARSMKPLGSTSEQRDDIPGLWQGQTTWGWEEAEGLCAVGWDWIEIMPGVPVLTDPMHIMSNASFINKPGKRGLAFAASSVVALNSVIYLLPWQADVLKTIPPRTRRSRSAAPTRSTAYPELRLAA